MFGWIFVFGVGKNLRASYTTIFGTIFFLPDSMWHNNTGISYHGIKQSNNPNVFQKLFSQNNLRVSRLKLEMKFIQVYIF